MKGVGETAWGQRNQFQVSGESLGQNGDKNLRRVECGELGWKTLTLRPKTWWLGRWKVTYQDKMHAHPSRKPPSSLVWPKESLQMNQNDLLFIVLVACARVVGVMCLALWPMWSCDLWQLWGLKSCVVVNTSIMTFATQQPIGRKVARVARAAIFSKCDLYDSVT